MRPLPALLGALVMSAPVAAADFPPPAGLPSRPEMPDPLVTFAGERVTSTEQWQSKRRPELKALFEHYMYGKMPPAPPSFDAKVLFEDKSAFAGKGALREVALTFGGPLPATIRLLVAVPNAGRPVGCFVGPNFGGNHLYLADDRVRVPDAWVPAKYPGVEGNRATAAGRGEQPDVWPFEQVVGRGYAVATFYCGDVQPDRPDAAEGLRPLVAPNGQTRGDETATVATWAWGVSRAVDYLVKCTGEIDPKRIAAVGHSRLGKTVLLAAAFDDRIAVAMPHQAGCGGTAPSRNRIPDKAETVKRINTSFPHWFCGHFKAFNDDPTRLPFDQNGLVAACAPRPVLFTNATEDVWANPLGQFDVLKAADGAYRLVAGDGLGADAMPAVGTLLDSRLGYWIRPGKHAMTPADWETFTRYADKWLK